MTTERVTIEVESNIGEDGPLTVSDTLHQFMDAFELLGAAIAEEAGGATIKWRLISMSKNSPAKTTAEAYSPDPALLVGPLLYRGKRRFADGMSALADGRVEPWVERNANVAKSFFARNLNGVGRTTFDLEEDAPRTVVVEKHARKSLAAIEQHEAAQAVAAEDRSRSERGTIDARVSEATTWHGHPALYVKERLSGRRIPCVLSESAAKDAGPTHSWADAWGGKRVRIKGQIFYDRAGAISRISALSVQDVNPTPVNLAELRQIGITAGKAPAEHLNDYWGYSDD